MTSFTDIHYRLHNGQLHFLYKYCQKSHHLPAGFPMLEKQSLPQILKKQHTPELFFRAFPKTGIGQKKTRFPFQKIGIGQITLRMLFHKKGIEQTTLWMLFQKTGIGYTMLRMAFQKNGTGQTTLWMAFQKSGIVQTHISALLLLKKAIRVSYFITT